MALTDGLALEELGAALADDAGRRRRLRYEARRLHVVRQN